MFLRGILFKSKPINEVALEVDKDSVEVSVVPSNNDNNKVDMKKRSVAAVSIAINYYQTVSALSQYLLFTKIIFIFSMMKRRYFSLPNSVISLLSASKVMSSATGTGVGLACISPALNDYKNLYTAIMLEPVVVIAFIFVMYPVI